MCSSHLASSIHFISVHVAHPYSRIDTTAAWKKLYFILLDRLDFQVITNLLIAVHAFARQILTSLSVDEALLPRYVNLSTNFRELPFRVEMSFFFFKLKPMYCFVCIHVEANATYCPLQNMQQGFGLRGCIYKKHYGHLLVCIHNRFCRALSSSCLF